MGEKIGYIRINENDPKTDLQLNGVDLSKKYVEMANSKERHRPRLVEMMVSAVKGDEIFVESMDKIALDVSHLVDIVNFLVGRGIVLNFIKEKISLSNINKNELDLICCIKGFEESVLKERRLDGIQIAKKRGLYKNPREKKLDAYQIAQIVFSEKMGVPKTKLCREFGVSRDTIMRYLRSAKKTELATVETSTTMSITPP